MAENVIRSWIRKTLTRDVAIAFLLGAIVGLVVFGWWLWPVRWTNADLTDLRPAYKESYLQAIADSYALNNNAELARTRLQQLAPPGESAGQVTAMLNDLIDRQLAAGKPDEALRLKSLSATMTLPPFASAQPTVTPTGDNNWSQLLRGLGIVFFLLLFGAGILLFLTQLQKREALRRRKSPAVQQPLSPEPEETVAPPKHSGALGQLETTYMAGEDGYDISAPLHSAAGEFLGEFGVSAIEETGNPDTKGVGAFEIWLFDKDDVRTVTKILMSERYFADPELRGKLADRAEQVQAQPGQLITLQTASLRLEAIVAELEYEDDAHASFAKLTTRMSATVV